jgi:ribosomal protein S3AE
MRMRNDIVFRHFYLGGYMCMRLHQQTKEIIPLITVLILKLSLFQQPPVQQPVTPLTLYLDVSNCTSS